MSQNTGKTVKIDGEAGGARLGMAWTGRAWQGRRGEKEDNDEKAT